MTKSDSLTDLVPTPDSNKPQCQVPLSGETPEVDLIVQQAISQHHNDLTSVADVLYQLGFAKLVIVVLNFSDSYNFVQNS